LLPKPDKPGNYGQLFSAADVEFCLGKSCFRHAIVTSKAYAIKVAMFPVILDKNLL
jgi:hypothetical protein